MIRTNLESLIKVLLSRPLKVKSLNGWGEWALAGLDQFCLYIVSQPRTSVFITAPVDVSGESILAKTSTLKQINISFVSLVTRKRHQQPQHRENICNLR